MMAVQSESHHKDESVKSHYISFTPSLQHYEEFICGWGSAFINIMITFPMNKVMFRQMLHGVDSQDAIRQLRKEGIQFLYRGCFPPLLQKTTSVSLMFGTYTRYGEAVTNTFPSLSPFMALCTAATLAGCTEAFLTPFERIQTLLQDRNYNMKFRNTFHVATELKRYGFREYYRGLTPILLRNSVGNIMFFSLKGKAKECLPKAETVLQHLLCDFISGAFVGAFTSTLFYPVNVAKTKMQVCYGTSFISFIEALRRTYNDRNRSLRKMYLGVHVNYTRAFLSWGIINASHELLMKLVFKPGSNS